jgi:uncharacterized membrane protein
VLAQSRHEIGAHFEDARFGLIKPQITEHAAASVQVHPEKPTYKYEKCYGVARAGMNDCSFGSNSCAGTLAKDNDPRSWIYVPQGTCKKITGGTLEPPK